MQSTEVRKLEIIDELKEKLTNLLDNFPCIKDIIVVRGERVVFENGLGLIRTSNTAKLFTKFEATDKKHIVLSKKLLELMEN